LPEKIHGSHIQRAFVVSRELGEILEDLRLGVDFAVCLDPLKTVIQKRRDCLRVSLGQGFCQTLVRLAERGRIIGSGKPRAR
jgi:hypothetical protein